MLKCWSTHGKQLSLLTENDFNRANKYSVSKRLFIHFYAMALVTNANVFLWELYFQNLLNLYRVFFGIHAWRRYSEHLFMFNKLPASRMHFTAYLFGLWFYVVVPLALCNPCVTPSKTQVVLFVLSQVLQFKSHRILYLMKRDSTQDGVVRYGVPTKGPFKYILCPHYLSEIMVYMSLICNCEMTSCFIFVFISMVVQAMPSKEWYMTTFHPSELSNKYAMFPYIL